MKTHPILKNDFAARWLGVQVVDAGAGFATLQLTVTQDMLNGFGIAHGGLLFALADTAFAVACNDANAPEDTATVASGADINFIKPVKLGAVLIAHAEERYTYGRSGIYDVRVLEGDEVVAEFRGRSRLIRNPRSPRKDS